jgi:uncharacterized protein
MDLDPELLELIVCPACRSRPVRDDIPVLLVDEARKPA